MKAKSDRRVTYIPAYTLFTFSRKDVKDLQFITFYTVMKDP